MFPRQKSAGSTTEKHTHHINRFRTDVSSANTPKFSLSAGASRLGVMLIRDLHKQSTEVTELACRTIMYLSPMPLIEAVVSSCL